MQSDTTTATVDQPAKYARYRSVRKATVNSTTSEDSSSNQSASVNRAPSRYRRARANSHAPGNLPAVPAVPSVPAPTKIEVPHDNLGLQTTSVKKAKPSSPAAKSHPDLRAAARGHVHQPPVVRPEYTYHGTLPPRSVRQKIDHSSPLEKSPVDSYEEAREEARQILEGEFDRMQKLKEAQKKRDQVLRAQTAKARYKSVQAATKHETRAEATSRAIKGQDTSAPGHTQIQPQRKTSPPDAEPGIPVKLATEALVRPKEVLPAAPAAMRSVEPLQIDAPVSAVNSGERRVEIRMNGATTGITLPVTPTTTAQELLNSASVVMSQSFDPRSSVLIEAFFCQVELERPLRRYERVRDVMNSWDFDSQNYMIIMTEADCTAIGLDKKDVPSQQPAKPFTLQTFYSSKPGKWDKRWTTLRPDGQVTVSKSENDSNNTNICHISDFDVYTPTRKQSKQLRSPKKICFAIKSQQKSSMFLDATNFVHYFATNDKNAAEAWYSAVQTWRSWYLADVLGEAERQQTGEHVYTVSGKTHRRNVTAQSLDEVPYQLGSFKPLLDFDLLGLGGSSEFSGPTRHVSKPSREIGVRPSFEYRDRPNIDRHRSVRCRQGHQKQSSRAENFSVLQPVLLDQVRNKEDLGIEDASDAFTGTGLLAHSASRYSQGNQLSGHGVASGPGKPLVDLTAQSEFADGSLLRQLEAWSMKQPSEHRVDRQKQVEAEIKVGEGLG